MQLDKETVLLHASCVSVNGNGVLICGAAGSGKSSLALNLIALGAELVADDQTLIRRENKNLIARCPETISHLIEARGLGILTPPTRSDVALTLVVDLETVQSQRVPPPEAYELFGITLPLFRRAPLDAFPAALYILARDGMRYDV
ncbi:HPr kinase/phosphatase C-terminal domain-containing protein [Rhodobacteraceae bacterium]|nr:HPr kinase/phosphatase C-terminal domain-containing protein [Paracoccaceae bacterium]